MPHDHNLDILIEKHGIGKLAAALTPVVLVSPEKPEVILIQPDTFLKERESSAERRNESASREGRSA